MPFFNKFDFYQRAYAINQAIGTVSIATSSIRMGDVATASYYGLAKKVSDTYATYDILSTYSNYQLFNAGHGGSPEYYTTRFSTGPNDQQAGHLANTFVGLPVPKVNETKQISWDQTCYPSALGDIRDNKAYNDLRDGAWVEAGYDPTISGHRIAIYRTDASGTDPFFINYANVSVTSTPIPTNHCRVFTSPGFNTNNVPGTGGGGHQLIAFFAWDGSTTTYYELFKWDLSAPPYGMITSIFQGSLSKYIEFPYSGKHDMFYLSKWTALQTYSSGCPYLLIVAGGTTTGDVYQVDLTNGSCNSQKGLAANYSDYNDVILIADNATGQFVTYIGDITIGSVDFEGVNGLNVFDIDYNWSLGTNYFFVGDDQQGASPNSIKGWLIYIDSVGRFSSNYYPSPTYFNYGMYYYENRYTGGPYTLNRVVAVDFGRIVVGSGPNLGTQRLFEISCIGDQSSGADSFYKAYEAKFFGSGTENEDFVAMNHGICEDWTGYFDPSGTYQTPNLLYGLPVGAGNQHILSVKPSMDVYASTKNFIGEYYNSPWGSYYSDHFNYIIYLGQAAWDSSTGGPFDHTGYAFFYMAVACGTSAAPFQLPASSPGGSATFAGNNGKLQLLVFYG